MLVERLVGWLVESMVLRRNEFVDCEDVLALLGIFFDDDEAKERQAVPTRKERSYK